jgi:hypothetical protein
MFYNWKAQSGEFVKGDNTSEKIIKFNLACIPLDTLGAWANFG